MNAEETLFSLELAVNSVRVVPRTLLCRMPAVAFRLLDFPSVIIEQMESTEMKQIKEAVQRVWGNGNDVPIQLEELKDRHGNYEFNKGKSSLLKYNINSLQSHLLNTPLYVMIVDLWNNAPKLVGHCNVALNGIMNEIKADVIESGISVPSVHGIQGRFPIFNLMGSEVGWISLGIRMLSLGGNLIPHIPDAALTRRSAATVGHPLGDVDINVPKCNSELEGAPSKQYQGRTEEETTKHANQNFVKARSASLSIPPIPKHVEVDISHPALDLRPVQSDYSKNVDEVGAVSHGSGARRGQEQIEANIHESNPCHSTVFLESEQSSDVDIITNTHIPPPLYFNSVNEPTKERKRDLEVHSGVQQTIHSQNTADTWRKSVDMQNDSKASSSSLGERRELEVHYVLHPPEYQGEPSVRKTLRKHHRDKSEKSMKNLENSVPGKAEVSRGGYEHEQENIGHQNVEDLRRMPILNALLRELSLLYRQDGSAVLPPPAENNFPNYPEGKQHHKKQERVQKESKTVHHKEPEPSPVVKSQSLKTYRHKHRDCAKPPSGVPASKGWLRQEPAVRRKKETKLQFKMTNSQKLRLQRHNPDAYQLLEEQERIAEIQFQIRSAQLQEERSKNSARKQRSKRTLSARPHQSEESYQLQERNVSTEISRHQDNLSPKDKTVDPGYAAGLETYMISADNLVNQEEDLEVGKKTLQHLPRQAVEHREQPAPEMLPENDVSSSEKSVHSISIRLPSALDQDDADDKDSTNDSSAENSQVDESKAVNVPGFSVDDLEGTGVQTETVVSGNNSGKQGMEIYSDDFNDSYRFESTGEQELASIKSSDGSARASQHSPLSDQRSPSVLSRDEAQLSHSSASSYKTAVSVESSGGSKGKDADAVSKTSTATSKSSKFSGSVGSKYPTSVLSIPQPQMSANSPVPLARRSTTKYVAFKHGSESQPPKPKPRHSLERTTSSISNTSLLAPDLTLSGNSSAVNTPELRPDSSDDYQPDGNYSDDFDSDDT